MNPEPFQEDPGAALLRGLSQFASRLKGVDGLTELYRRSAAGGEEGFFGRVLRGLGLEVDSGAWPQDFAANGPLLLIAAGPLDAVACLGLMAAIERRRPDLAALGTRALGWMPEIHSRMMLLQAAKAATTENSQELRRALRQLHSGGALACFPWPGAPP